jgi:DNA ligase (NAD+)
MERIQELVEQITYHTEKYSQGIPEISDAEFDVLIEELKNLDPENDALKLLGKNLGYGKKVKHPQMMGSLNKAKTWEELLEWAKACGHRGGSFVLMPKIDGCAIRLEYKEGELVLAATRGDGSEGQDVTDNAKMINGIPWIISNFTGEIRGEVYMRKSVWEKMGSGSNPRNCAVGSLLQKDPKITGERNLDFLVYDIRPEEQNLFTTEFGKLNFFSNIDLDVVSRYIIPAMDQDFHATLMDWENNLRQKLDYEIDGMVLAIDDLDAQESMGWVGKCPKGKIAYKFKPEQKIAELMCIDWQVGRTGRVTPVAVVSATRLAGTTVTSVSLHNAAVVEDLDLRIGDRLLIEKAGDIIPQLSRVVEKANPPGESLLIEICPVCGYELNWDGNGVSLWCSNSNCPAKLERTVLHYLSTIGVMGVGPGIISKLCKSKMVQSITDLYFLEQQELVELLGGERNGEKIYLAIMEKNEINLAVFLDALGIDGLGTTTSKDIAKKFKTLDAVRKASTLEFLGINGIGSLSARKIFDGLVAQSLIIDGLLKCIEVKDVEEIDGPLKGKSFCITGSLSKQRSLVESDIADAGGECKSSVGKGLSYLVTNDKTGGSAKNVKAQKLGTAVIDETDLYAMINGFKKA